MWKWSVLLMVLLLAGCGSKKTDQTIGARPSGANSKRHANAPRASSADSPLTPQHVRITWTTDPQTRAVISWSTEESGSSHVVHYDIQARNGQLDAYTLKKEADLNGQLGEADPTPTEGATSVFEESQETADIHFHHALLQDLKPFTTYYFVVLTDGKKSREFHFKTAPGGNEPFKIISGGDSRTDRGARAAINEMIADLAEKDEGIIAFAHGGDYVNWGADPDQFWEWLLDHEDTVTRSGRVLPVIPTRGNHESHGPVYDQVFSTPGGKGRNYFLTQLSPQVAMYTLNSEIRTDGEQQNWLAEKLKTTRTARWLIAQYHTPAFPAVKSPGSALNDWIPLFDEFQADLVIECDGHLLKRTVPIRMGKKDPGGVVYIGEGGLGAPLREPDTERWYMKPPAVAASKHHVWVLSFEKDALRFWAVVLDGEERFAEASVHPKKRIPVSP